MARLEGKVLELGGRADLIRRELDQLVGRQITTAGIADQDADPPPLGPSKPRQDALRQTGVIPAVAGHDDVDVRRLFVEHVAPDAGDPVAVCLGN